MEKESKNKKKKLSLWKNRKTWGLMILVIAMPILTIFITSVSRSPFKSFATSNDWIGFFGSYIGAIIGGLITLLVMYETIENGDENLKKSMHQNEVIQCKNNKISFCNDIATIVAQFCGSIRVFTEDLRMLNQFFRIYSYWVNEYNNRNKKLKEYNKKQQINITYKEMEESVKSAKRYLDDSKKEYSNARNKLSNYGLITNLFLLEIKLKDIEEAKLLLIKIKKLNREIEIYTQPRDIETDAVQDIKNLDLKIKDILEETTNFINKYSNSK